jgi:hypothetical protein
LEDLAQRSLGEEGSMSEDGRAPDSGTTWDELSAIWDEVRDIVSAWAESQPADEREG